MKIVTDDDVAWTSLAAKAVRRDMHKMKAFVRFREVTGPDGAVFIAWFEPSNDIVARVAPFFVRRFAGMRWSILTPRRNAHWNGEVLSLDAGAHKGDAPTHDGLEDLWRTCFANIFNPARLKVRAMTREMPVRYRKNLPEASLIPGLIRDASLRMQAMVEKAPTVPEQRVPAPLPHEPVAMPEGSTAQLREQARTAALVHSGTLRRRPSFARGQMLHALSSSENNPAIREISPDAHFVGPAGELFNQALAEAGVDRRALYVNNTDTHFMFEPRDKRRLHSRGRTRTSRPHAGTGSRPNSIAFGPVPSCVGTRWRHKVNFGSRFRLLEQRGQWVALDVQTRGFATVHSSYLLRLPNEAGRTRGYQDFVRDLKLMRDLPPGEL